MCILFVYTDPAPKPGGYRIVIASNRDETYSRPAAAAHTCEKTNVIGGRDMEVGRENGMWLGISPKRTEHCRFRFGALLNVTGEGKKSGVKGRGFIVTDFLKGSDTAEQYVDCLEKSEEVLNSFNFVAVELSDGHVKTYHTSNAPPGCKVFEGKQVMGFGNSTCESPLQKVQAGKERFLEIINKNNSKERKDELYKELLDLLRWRKKHLPDDELSRRAPGIVDKLCQVYVEFISAGYGTRTHSIILVDYDWNCDFIEDSMKEPIDPNNPCWGNVRISPRL